MSLGTSGAFIVMRTCHLLTGRVRRSNIIFPLRLKIARTKGKSDKEVGSTINVSTLLSRNVNGAVEISLARSPRGRLPITHCLTSECSKGLRSSVMSLGLRNTETITACETPSHRELLLSFTYSFKGELLSERLSRLTVTSYRRDSCLTSRLLRTTHHHFCHPRCVTYPNYNHAVCGLRTAFRRIGHHATRLGNVMVTIVNYVIGNPNRVTSTS